MTKTYAIFGTGGVGKTTTSAALAHALARAGRRTLVTTIDPARRLADVLGVPRTDSGGDSGGALPLDDAATAVRSVPGTPNLFMVMPHSRASAHEVATSLLGNHPHTLESLRKNPVFDLLCDGLAGVHELASITALAEKVDDYDALVIDTAPSRHGIELLTLPRRLQDLVDSRALRWLGDLSRERLDERRGVGRLLNWGKRRFVAGFERSLGSTVVADTMEVLTAVALARQELSAAVRRAERMLCGPDVDRWVVLSPSLGGVSAALPLARQIASVTGRPPTGFAINRAVTEAPAWAERLAGLASVGAAVRADARTAAAEFADGAEQTRRAEGQIAGEFPTSARVCVPHLTADAEPAAIAEQAAGYLASAVARAAGGPEAPASASPGPAGVPLAIPTASPQRA